MIMAEVEFELVVNGRGLICGFFGWIWWGKGSRGWCVEVGEGIVGKVSFIQS